jgi:hypothetical protein
MIDKLTLLTNLIYLEEGMVTPCQSSDWTSPPDGDHIRVALNNMDPDQARLAKRKFRKLHRQMRKRTEREVKELLVRSNWNYDIGGTTIPVRKARELHVAREVQYIHTTYGTKGNAPTVGQARKRRRDVYSLVRRQTMEDTNVD